MPVEGMGHSFQMLALTSLAICAWGEVSGLTASSRVKIGADPLLALQQNS